MNRAKRGGYLFLYHGTSTTILVTDWLQVSIRLGGLNGFRTQEEKSYFDFHFALKKLYMLEKQLILEQLDRNYNVYGSHGV